MTIDSLHIFAGCHAAGLLSRRPSRPRGTSFVYGSGAPPHAQVSLTMPLRPESWDMDHGLPPIFEMNLPEGMLRDWLTKLFSKAVGEVDDFRLLQLTGHSQIGRLRVANSVAASVVSPAVAPPAMSWKELLAAHSAPGAEELFDHLLRTYAVHSGLSGVQPKVLLPVSEAKQRVLSSRPDRATFQGATHIVKAWREYPELAANEYFCLMAAREAGLPVSQAKLSADGRLLVVDRFDFAPDNTDDAPGGSYLGFEDFCVLQGKQSARKYVGSYEKAAETMRRFVAPARAASALAFFFEAIAFSVAIRNGDAHLKNFGVLYATPEHGSVTPAPVYDVVTTTAYLPQDQMALTLAGSKKWPNAKRLLAFGVTRCDLSTSQARRAMGRIADSLHATMRKIERYMSDRPEFKAVGTAMLEFWKVGASQLCP